MGTMLFLSKDDKAAIPQSHELLTSFSHVLMKHMYTSTCILMFPCFYEIIVKAFPPRTRIGKWGMNLRLTHFTKCYWSYLFKLGKIIPMLSPY